MRELKFRAYLPEIKRFHYFSMGNFHLSDYHLLRHSHQAQQYTGLQDSNGKDIYEGDLVRYSVGNRVYVEQIAWENFGWVFLSFDGGSSSPIMSLPSLEVIGNITENPELKTP